MADETREEDLSELEGTDAVLDRVRELLDDGWQPDTLSLHRPEKSATTDPGVLRDDPLV
jgi:hypothetical protein